MKASGHVNKFTYLMVKDGKTWMCYQADHLLKNYRKGKLEEDLLLSENVNELKQVLAVLDEISAESLGAKIKEYGITSQIQKIPFQRYDRHLYRPIRRESRIFTSRDCTWHFL
jgi:glycyl-tRNA synthetase